MLPLRQLADGIVKKNRLVTLAAMVSFVFGMLGPLPALNRNAQAATMSGTVASACPASPLPQLTFALDISVSGSNRKIKIDTVTGPNNGTTVTGATHNVSGLCNGKSFTLTAPVTSLGCSDLAQPYTVSLTVGGTQEATASSSSAKNFTLVGVANAVYTVTVTSVAAGTLKNGSCLATITIS